jgi:hypothetical protein
MADLERSVLCLPWRDPLQSLLHERTLIGDHWHQDGDPSCSIAAVVLFFRPCLETLQPQLTVNGMGESF